jgi:hypothetical protein
MQPKFLVMVVATAVLCPRVASAHALRAECSLGSGKVQVEAFFDDDAPAVNAKVEVLDHQAKTMAAGKTNAQGLWAFPAPAAGYYLVIVDAGMGHRAKVPITVPEAITAAGPLSEKKEIISEGVARKEATSFPYLLYKVGLGVVAIVLFSLAFLLGRRKLRGSEPLP